MTDYEYGDREAELRHAHRELRQLDLGYTSGALSEGEYVAARQRVRDRHRLPAWGVNTGP